MATDPATQIAALQAILAQCDLLLNGGVTLQAENGRAMRHDLSVVRQQRNDAAAQLAVLTGSAPQIRRLLVSTPSRGY